MFDCCRRKHPEQKLPVTVVAVSIASTLSLLWISAECLCAVTTAVAQAVEHVATVGWKADSCWNAMTHWLQPHHVKEIARTVILCFARVRSEEKRLKGNAILATPPIEIWHFVLWIALSRVTPVPKGMVQPPKTFRIAPEPGWGESPEPKQGGESGGCCIS